MSEELTVKELVKGGLRTCLLLEAPPHTAASGRCFTHTTAIRIDRPCPVCSSWNVAVMMYSGNVRFFGHCAACGYDGPKTGAGFRHASELWNSLKEGGSTEEWDAKVAESSKILGDAGVSDIIRNIWRQNQVLYEHRTQTTIL